MKFISAPRNAPQPITIGPKDKVACCHAPPGINGVIIGIIILSTKDFTRTVAAEAIINAIANPITLYSSRNSLNSEIICFIRYLEILRL